jgi:hypothetical protein
MFVRFQVLTAASMKKTVFWDVAPCSLVEVFWRFRGACCLHHQGDSTRLHGARSQKTSHLQAVCLFTFIMRPLKVNITQQFYTAKERFWWLLHFRGHRSENNKYYNYNNKCTSLKRKCSDNWRVHRHKTKTAFCIHLLTVANNSNTQNNTGLRRLTLLCVFSGAWKQAQEFCCNSVKRYLAPGSTDLANLMGG